MPMTIMGKVAFKNAAAFMKNEEHKDAYGLVGYTLKDTLSEHGSVSRGVCSADENNTPIIGCGTNSIRTKRQHSSRP